MSARSAARNNDAIYRDPPEPYRIGQRVQCPAGRGEITHIAHSMSSDAPIYTVQVSPRHSYRLLGREIKPF